MTVKEKEEVGESVGRVRAPVSEVDMLGALFEAPVSTGKNT